MKKVITLLLAALLVFSLAACGGKDKPSNDPLTRDDGTTQGQQTPPPDNTEPPSDTSPEVDFGAVMGGATDTVWGKQDEATKQAIIEAGKEDGVDVSFGADGSMTVVDTDGSIMVQKPDGTWTYQDEEGGEGQIGGDWPDNEYTKLVPKPDFDLISAGIEGTSFIVMFNNVELEQMKDYADKVKAAGFDIDEQGEEMEYGGEKMFSYSASNADGYTVEIFSASGTSGMSISKP